MRQVPVKLGPLALLLTVVSICLTTLAILVFTTARADVRLAEKYAQTVHERYELEAEGQAYLAGVSNDPSLLSEPDADGISWNTLDYEGARLIIGIKTENGIVRVVSWRHEREWTEDTDIGNLWNGK